MKQKIILSFLMAMMVFALSGQKDIRKADKLLSLKAFDLAIKNYNSVISMNPTHAMAHAQLAEAYRMTNQPLEALKAYEKAFELSDDLSPDYQLNYAHTLKKVGLYNQASSWYASYNAIDPAMADYWINNNEFAKALLQEKDTYDILSFDGNSEESDFGVSFFKDKVIFASFREDLKRENDKLNRSYINQKGNQLFVAPSNEFLSKDQLSFLRPDFKETHNIGPVSYSRDGRMVAFMRNNFSKSSNFVFSDESDMSIYFAFTDDNGDFADAKPFPYNQVEYSYAFPSLGFNGSALYFASNRPGGYGGFDIYVSYFKDAKWSSPENLGPAINSAGNEITPYFDGEELYFSSDYRNGLGGYDIFGSEVVEGNWIEATNKGKGINSPSDDYYFTVDHSTGNFYYSSNRLGGRGKDDIYIAFPIAEQEEMLAVEVAVPVAVNLDDLAEANASDQFLTLDDADITEATVIPVSSEETVAFEAEEEFDFEGAVFSEVVENNMDNQEVYFIQLASLAQSNGKLSNYTSVDHYGNLYRFFKPNAVKIRLGYYANRSEAESILYNVKSNGFNDAFITTDILAVSNFELINASEYNSNTSTSFVDDYNINSQYKVKLASYNDPLKFNVEAIKDAGRLEQWTKGQWTIFVLGGFATIEEAKKAQIKAMNRGWRDAELVVDEGGILRKITAR